MLKNKKPSALFVYLTLEAEARKKPMRREEIVKYISDHFNVNITPKTVTEAADVLKSLSDPEHKVIDFHSKGKSGYMLGNIKSPLSKEEIIQFLMSFSSISTSTSQNAFLALEPYMNMEDAEFVRKVTSRFPFKQQFSEGTIDYFEKLHIILDAFDQKKEVVFTHRYVDTKVTTIKEEKKAAIVPYFIFEKNGRFYLLGGKMGGLDTNKGKKSCLYIADIDHMHDIQVGEESASDLPISLCVFGKDFNLGRYLGQVFFIREGIFHPASEKGYLAKIYDEAAYLLTKQMYGSCVEDVKTDVIKSSNETVGMRTIYLVRLHLDWPALIMWSLYFAQRGKLLLDLLSLETKFLIPAIAGHAGRAEDQYVEYYNRQISDEEKNKIGK